MFGNYHTSYNGFSATRSGLIQLCLWLASKFFVHWFSWKGNKLSETNNVLCNMKIVPLLFELLSRYKPLILYHYICLPLTAYCCFISSSLMLYTFCAISFFVLLTSKAIGIRVPNWLIQNTSNGNLFLILVHSSVRVAPAAPDSKF